jgi:hypothetical protein
MVPVGFLATSSNSGHFTSMRWAFLPEAGFNLRYTFGEHFCVMGGYTVLWLDHVARAGEQIDRFVNPTLTAPTGTVPPTAGPVRPEFLLHQSAFMAQGINLGFEVRY